MDKTNKKLRFIVQTGIIAAIYAVLTILSAPLSYGPIQVRLSEALCVLPFFTPAAIPGLFLGCIIANTFGGLGPIDIIFGSLATLISAGITYFIKVKWLVPLPAVIINAVAVGFILNIVLSAPLFATMGYVAAGQLVACYGLGLPLLYLLNKQKKNIFAL